MDKSSLLLLSPSCFSSIRHFGEPSPTNGDIFTWLGHLYSSGEFSDITFICSNFKLPNKQESPKPIRIMAHKCIVAARCPLLYQNMVVNCHDGVVEVNDFDAMIFKHFIKYLYTTSLALFSPHHVCPPPPTCLQIN